MRPTAYRPCVHNSGQKTRRKTPFMGTGPQYPAARTNICACALWIAPSGSLCNLHTTYGLSATYLPAAAGLHCRSPDSLGLTRWARLSPLPTFTRLNQLFPFASFRLECAQLPSSRAAPQALPIYRAIYIYTYIYIIYLIKKYISTLVSSKKLILTVTVASVM